MGSPLLILLLTWVVPSLATVCIDGTGPVFFVDRLSNKNDHCFEKCSNTDCTGVLVSATSCVALNTDKYFGPIRDRDLIRKHCVQDVTATLIVSLHEDRVILDHTERILKAVDKFHCLSLCYNEKKFTCLSAMFYVESKDCLLNSANSDSAKTTMDTEGFELAFMERRLEGPSPCSSSFQLLAWNERQIKGSLKSFETNSLQMCLATCGKTCDYVLFNEAESKCITVYSEENSAELKFIDQNYQVFENLCKATLSECSGGYMYIANKGFTKDQKQNCLQKCLTDKSCQYAYSTPNGCTVSSRKQPQRSTVEKKCSGTEKLEMDILYEESEKCPTTTGMSIEGIDKTQCMTLCLTHPTKSCEAISYYHPSRLCQLLDGSMTSSSKVTSLPMNAGCRHYTLNIITISRERNYGHRSEGKTHFENKNHPKKSRAHAAKTKLDIHKIDSTKPEKHIPINITVETICKYHQVVVKVTSPTGLHGQLFPRNSHSNCSVEMGGKTEASLIFDLQKGNCRMDKDGSIYRAVIVVKENKMHNLPVITEDDKLYSISCDYSNQESFNISTTRVLKLRDDNYKHLSLPGKIPFSKTMTMELRQKRTHKDESKTVSLGQDVDLVFYHEKKNISSNYVVSSCIASTMDNGDNLTLIENGCPTRSAREYIVRGDVRQSDDGFSLPMRAFKFQKEDSVKIACTLQLCEDECEKPSCNQLSRQRRMLPEGAWPNARPEVDVEVAMLVKDGEETKRKMKEPFCLSPYILYGLSSLGTIILLLQLITLIYILRKQYRK